MGRGARRRGVIAVAVDVVIELEARGIVLITRRNPPSGWALPGGFVEYGGSGPAKSRGAKPPSG